MFIEKDMRVAVVSDIAGEYKTLMALIEKLPKDCKVLAVGDLPDRGSDSDKVIQWFIDNSDRADSLIGNHCDMMIDACRNEGRYEKGIWEWNGGNTTLLSYNSHVPKEHLDFLASRPDHIVLEIDEKKYFISHAVPTKRWLETGEEDDEIKLWNRWAPVETDKYDWQVFGHQSHWGLRYFSNNENKQYAVCIDTSRSKILTALHLPSMKIYQQEYIND